MRLVLTINGNYARDTVKRKTTERNYDLINRTINETRKEFFQKLNENNS